MKNVDVRTLACPGPVIQLKEQFAAGETALRFHVRDELARSNVTRFAKSRNAVVDSESDGTGGFFLTIDAGDAALAASPKESIDEFCEVPAASAGSVVVQVANDRMGAGDDELGALLLRGFLKTLLQLDRKPDQILFYNAGVFLCCEGSVSLEDIRRLEASGVEIITCGTCLNFFEKAKELRVGRVSDMLEIATSLAQASRVMRP